MASILAAMARLRSCGVAVSAMPAVTSLVTSFSACVMVTV
jgi:hypothetical protein